jgi:NAD(P)-dependent dehydrogenase (short-subunit alcohol dehydrogenase family)
MRPEGAETATAADGRPSTSRMGAVAQAALFLASDRARQITGILMPVDGDIWAGDTVNHADELMAAHERILRRLNARS